MLDCTRGQGSAAERPEELARPHLHEFLAACYEHYDIVIWSATSMKWIEVCGHAGCALCSSVTAPHLIWRVKSRVVFRTSKLQVTQLTAYHAGARWDVQLLSY